MKWDKRPRTGFGQLFYENKSVVYLSECRGNFLLKRNNPDDIKRQQHERLLERESENLADSLADKVGKIRQVLWILT